MLVVLALTHARRPPGQATMVAPGFRSAVLGIIEDGGELVVMTATVWLGAGLVCRPALDVEPCLGRAA